MLSELFDGAGPLAVGPGRNRLSESLSAVLLSGAPSQRAAAESSALSLLESRAGMLDLHDRIAQGQLTEATFLRGRALAARLDYPSEVIDHLPDRLVERFIGLANPFVFGRANPGEVVVDVGCGAGLDAAIAQHDVGPSGLVIGFDATHLMVDTAHRLAADSAPQPRFGRAFAEQLPLRAESVDLIISNGVLMMCDRPVALTEFHRILRPGGRVQFADSSFDERGQPRLVTEWRSTWSKSLTLEMWHDLLAHIGFDRIEFGPVTQPQRRSAPSPSATHAIRAVKRA